MTVHPADVFGVFLSWMCITGLDVQFQLHACLQFLRDPYLISAFTPVQTLLTLCLQPKCVDATFSTNLEKGRNDARHANVLQWTQTGTKTVFSELRRIFSHF